MLYIFLFEEPNLRVAWAVRRERGEDVRQRIFFIWIRCNPLKSPNSAKGFQGNPSLFSWFSLDSFGFIWFCLAARKRLGRWRLGANRKVGQTEDRHAGRWLAFHPSVRAWIVTHPIILHHFDRSPFSEKIRVVFGFKGLSWRSVRIPQIMPKPDLMPLTGGYRRTPVMQIGADVFCDTQIIIREIERRFPSPTLFPPGAAGVPWGLSSWTDRAFFQNAVNLVFGTLGPKVPQAFVEDRSQLRGRQVRSRQDAGGDSADARSAARPARLDRGATRATDGSGSSEISALPTSAPT